LLVVDKYFYSFFSWFATFTTQLNNFTNLHAVIFFKCTYMLKRMLTVLLLSGIAAVSAQAQHYKTAVGLRLSSNDATVNHSVSAKHFLNKIVALEGLFSFDPVALGVLAEVHHPVSSAPGLRWLFGGGGFMRFSEGVGGGAQGILGLDYKFLNIPLNLTIDWKPELHFTDGVLFEPAAVGFSARFTLK
jgi:hypothetical protein